MAIYMGEKLAMLTRQIIPDHLAENVSKLLNIHEDTPRNTYLIQNIYNRRLD